MTIQAECPHCETRFHLRPELAGRPMRCPECQRVFDVAPLAARQPPPAPPRRGKKPAFEIVDDAVLDAEVVDDGAAGRPRSKPGKPKRPPADPKPPARRTVVEARPAAPLIPKFDDPSGATKPIPAARPAPPPADRRPPANGPREVAWNASAAPPPPRPTPEPAADDGELDDVLIRRAKRKTAPKVILGVMVALIGGLLVGGGAYLLRYKFQVESQLATKAESAYRDKDFPAAARDYAQLAADYPDSDDAAKYAFFAALADTQVKVGGVTNRENPTPALDRLKGFVAEHGKSPYAKPESGFGRDLLDAGRRVADDVTRYAEDRIAAFRGDRANKGDELARAEDAIGWGRDAVNLVEPFRAKDDPPLDPLRAKFDELTAQIGGERDRLVALAELRTLLADPTDAKLQDAEARLSARRLEADADARRLLDTARTELRKRIAFAPDAVPPLPAPPAGPPSLAFAPPLGPVPKPAANANGPGGEPAVFLALARGVVYALDEETGTPLWAARVGPDAEAAPVVATFAGAEAGFALLPTAAGGEAGLTCRDLRTGQPVWHQPLPAAVAGQPVAVGTRALVPVRDTDGSVFEVDLTTGHRLGRMALGQPVGPGAARVPGTGLVLVAADARRVFVIDADARDADGNRQPPRCVRVLDTGHPAGTLRCVPTVAGPDRDPAAPRLVVLCQADGPRQTRLRAFQLPMVLGVGDGEPGTADAAAPAVADLPVGGWVWFPPACDGERLAVATDDGRAHLFGLGRPGAADRPLFPLPVPSQPSAAAAAAEADPVPGLVAAADDDHVLALLNGAVVRLRPGIAAAGGFRVSADGKPAAFGVPVQAARPTSKRDAALVVVRAIDGGGVRAAAVDLNDGRPRWQRVLGLATAAPPRPHAGGLLVADEDGGLALLPPAVAADSAPGVRLADAGLVVAPPLPDATGPTATASSPDDRVAYAVTPFTRDGRPQYAVRRLVGGKKEADAVVPAPARPAGPPALVGDALLLPLADGFVHRFTPGARQLAVGPAWRGERAAADARCHVTPLTADEFLTTDGGRGVVRWKWPAGGSWAGTGVRWEAPDAITLPPAAVPGKDGGPADRFVAGGPGGVWLFGLDRGGPPVKRWRGHAGGLPAGTVGVGLTVAAGPVAVTAFDGRHLAAIGLDGDGPAWTATNASGPDGDELLGWTTAGDRLLVTDRAGRVSTVALTGGAAVGQAVAAPAGFVARSPAAALGGAAVVVGADGTVVVVRNEP